MNLRSVEFRQVAFDAVLSFVVWGAVWTVSRQMRERMTAPEGMSWLWPGAIVSALVTYLVLRNRTKTVWIWLAIWGAIYLPIQLLVQLHHAGRL